VLQCVTVCCAVCCSELQCSAELCAAHEAASILRGKVPCVWQCVVECCIVLQCVAVCRSVSQCVAEYLTLDFGQRCYDLAGQGDWHICVVYAFVFVAIVQCVVVCCSVLQNVAACCSVAV